MFTGASHSIIVVFAQRLIPGGMGLASGLILGFMFSSGSVGALLSGFLADLWGVPFVFGLSAVLVVIAAGLALVLRETPAPVTAS
jgi:FSR family fosmidomycin resistance protein-like MFS transporter